MTSLMKRKSVGRRVEWIIQLVFWILLLLLLTSMPNEILPLQRAVYFGAINVVLMMIVAYVNALLLIPRWLDNGKLHWYAIAAITLLAGATIVGVSLTANIFRQFATYNFPMRKPEHWPLGGLPAYLPYVRHFMQATSILLLSSSYQLAKGYRQKQQQNSVLIQEKTAYELNFLRSQINPHFLFNALNNLQATAVLHPERTSEFALKLGEMLRYVLEDCMKEKVSLTDEIRYLQNYIFFQQQRDSTLNKVAFSVSGENPANYYIEPMIFITLVENAFQHSYTPLSQQQWIEIVIRLSDGTMSIVVQNNLPIFSPQHQNKSNGLGLGLANISRRLALRYPQKHTLSYGPQNGYYCASLSLKL